MQLVEELGKARMASLPPPKKGSFWGNMSSKPAPVDKRRQELQEWLFALIRDPVIAHSRVLNTFLELADAARFVQRWASLIGACCPAGCCGVWAFPSLCCRLWHGIASAPVRWAQLFKHFQVFQSPCRTMLGPETVAKRVSARSISHLVCCAASS